MFVTSIPLVPENSQDGVPVSVACFVQRHPSPQTKCWAQTSIGPNRELKPLVPRIPLREGSQYKKSNPIVTEQLENQNCARLLAARTFKA